MSPDQREGIRKRDPRALAELFERYFDEVYGLAFQLLYDQAAAEDAVREAFLKAHQSTASCDSACDPKRWLFKIAYGACCALPDSLSRTISRAAHARASGEPSASSPTSDGPSREDSPVVAERDRVVTYALTKLPLDQRAVVLLHDQQGLMYDEIAEIMGASADSVQERHAQALVRLSSELRGVLS